MSKRELIAMDIHEYGVIDGGGTSITRVVGGWIYTTHRLDQGAMTSVFVPEPKEAE